MGLADLAARERAVSWWGRRIVCRPPTVLAVQLFLDLFGLEVLAIAVAQRAAQITASREAVNAIAPQLLANSKSGEVLAVCCRWADGGHDLSELLAKRPLLRALVAREVLAQCDVGRIAASLETARAVERFFANRTPDPPPATGGLEQTVVLLAEMFGLDPTEIADWPYERFLTVLDALEAIAERRRKAAGKSESDGASDAHVPDIGIDDLSAFFGQAG